jgi:RNase P subunit RPR2
MTWRAVPAADPVLGDYRRYPGCRLRLTCALCGWSKAYSAERVIERLRALRAGGHDTPVGVVARRVAWTCPGCGRVRWRSDLAWPPGMDEREVQRLANLYRN